MTLKMYKSSDSFLQNCLFIGNFVSHVEVLQQESTIRFTMIHLFNK